MALPILKPGARAYWDTFAGLVPCRVTAIRTDRPDDPRPASWQSVDVEVTESTGPYAKGHRELQLWGLHVIPPGAIIRGQFSTRIGPYHVQGGPACSG